MSDLSNISQPQPLLHEVALTHGSTTTTPPPTHTTTSTTTNTYHHFYNHQHIPPLLQPPTHTTTSSTPNTNFPNLDMGRWMSKLTHISVTFVAQVLSAYLFHHQYHYQGWYIYHEYQNDGEYQLMTKQSDKKYHMTTLKNEYQMMLKTKQAHSKAPRSDQAWGPPD